VLIGKLFSFECVVWNSIIHSRCSAIQTIINTDDLKSATGEASPIK